MWSPRQFTHFQCRLGDILLPMTCMNTRQKGPTACNVSSERHWQSSGVRTQGRHRTMYSTAALDGIDRNHAVCRVLVFSWRSHSCFDSSHRGCSVDAITGSDVRYANSAPYRSTDFFSIALTVCTDSSALPLLCGQFVKPSSLANRANS